MIKLKGIIKESKFARNALDKKLFAYAKNKFSGYESIEGTF